MSPRRPLANRLSTFGKALALTLVAALSAAWVRPGVPTSAKPTEELADRLDYMVVEVQGTPRVVRAGEELAVVAGDRVKIVSAHLQNATRSVTTVNVAGYQNPKTGGAEDRGVEIDTGTELMPSWSESGEGKVWAVTATSRGVLHGAIYLKLVEPVLKYAVLSINGEQRVLRDGEATRIKSSDRVKVESVVTNLDSTKDVVFQIYDPAPDLAGPKSYEVRFLRGDLVFARIPLEVVD